MFEEGEDSWLKVSYWIWTWSFNSCTWQRDLQPPKSTLWATLLENLPECGTHHCLGHSVPLHAFLALFYLSIDHYLGKLWENQHHAHGTHKTKPNTVAKQLHIVPLLELGWCRSGDMCRPWPDPSTNTLLHTKAMHCANGADATIKKRRGHSFIEQRTIQPPRWHRVVHAVESLLDW